jgi:hypothetical protein
MRIHAVVFALAACEYKPFDDRQLAMDDVARGVPHAMAQPIAGSYTCVFDGVWTPCAIRTRNGHLVLEELAGPRRFWGRLEAAGDTYRFTGQLFCPFESCTARMTGWLAARDLHGTLQARDGAHALDMRDRTELGGAGYGGARY